MRLRRNRPARCARTMRSCSSCTLNKPLGNFSRMVPVTSMLSSLLIAPLGSRPQVGSRPRVGSGLRTSRSSQSTPGWSVSLLSTRCRFHVGGLQTLGAAGHFELYAGAFIQRFVPAGLNSRKMHENILAGFALDESEAFGRVKPLHCTFFSHYLTS